MEEMLWQFVKMCGGNATVPLATTVLILVMARKGYITINRQGDNSNGTAKGTDNGNGNSKKLQLSGICTVPGCHDMVVVTATKVQGHDKCLEDLKEGQEEIFRELRGMPDKIVERIARGK